VNGCAADGGTSRRVAFNGASGRLTAQQPQGLGVEPRRDLGALLPLLVL
jgi:hypothetical protein